MNALSDSVEAAGAGGDVPSGYRLLEVDTGPFFARLGPVYCREDVRADGSTGLLLGLRVSPEHLNQGGLVHGGMLITLADVACGMNLRRASATYEYAITASMTVDFLGAPQVGTWLAARVEIDRLGRRLAFCTCFLQAEGKLVLRASAVFVPPASGDGATSTRSERTAVPV